MKDFFRHNGILILIAAILLALVTAVVSMLFGGVADPLSNLVGIVTTPVRNGITAVTNWAEEKYNDAFELEQMKEELAGLKQRNAELEAQAREAEAALQENERLRNLLELQPKEWSCDKAAAMVTARSTSNWESTLTIGKGSAAGIAVDDCVVDEYWNLVGVVAAISAGGAGAVFWMWISALLGSSTAFIEATLSQLYKQKDPLYGGYRGGPAYYIHQYAEQKLGGKPRRYSVIAVLFAISGLICWCGISQVISNSVSSSFQNAFNIPPPSCWWLWPLSLCCGKTPASRCWTC